MDMKEYSKPIIEIENILVEDILGVSVSNGAYDDGFDWNGKIH